MSVPPPPPPPPGVPPGTPPPGDDGRPGATGPQQHPWLASGPPTQQPPQYGAPGPPNPYTQPTQGWAVAPTVVPGGPGKPPSDRGKLIAAIAVSVVLVIGVAVAGVVVVRGGGAEPVASPSPTPEPEPEETEPEGGGNTLRPDDPRSGTRGDIEPIVADDWLVQTNTKRSLAFDVPPEWSTNSEDTFVYIEDEREGVEDEEEPEPEETAGEEDEDEFDFDFPEPNILVGMSATAMYGENWCPERWTSRVIAGSKGSLGATGTANAATSEARDWAFSSYDQYQEGDFEITDPEPFTTTEGLEGHTVTATISGGREDPEDACDWTEGKVVAFSYRDARADLATWILVTDTGHDEEIDDELIETIMGSLRRWDG
ncbi:hypothetical protein [Streptomyces sp. ST2-7A]|uniref:hypothetical protein n=1 Tax=Streptomyces sp. ST2-7A TaxID=2907214 RepID=UPI001F17F934|nr:hypothetical protein [Streptomyces sp. ST2-7A]MCE7080590.1 hypothetical protein [Streptomyces sp. ST2-7A]